MSVYYDSRVLWEYEVDYGLLKLRVLVVQRDPELASFNQGFKLYTKGFEMTRCVVVYPFKLRHFFTSVSLTRNLMVIRGPWQVQLRFLTLVLVGEREQSKLRRKFEEKYLQIIKKDKFWMVRPSHVQHSWIQKVKSLGHDTFVNVFLVG